MTAPEPEITPTPPPAAVFAAMRAAEGWGRITEETAQAALDGSLAFATAHAGGAVVGFARLVGDGALNAYVHDLIVAPEWRGRGLGGRLLPAVAAAAPPGSMIGLFAAGGREAFYARHAFAARPSPGYGPGMMRWSEGG